MILVGISKTGRENGNYCAYKELQNNDLRMLEDFLLWEQD